MNSFLQLPNSKFDSTSAYQGATVNNRLRYYRHWDQCEINKNLYWFACCEKFLPISHVYDESAHGGDNHISHQLWHYSVAEMLHEFELMHCSSGELYRPDNAPSLAGLIKIKRHNLPLPRYIKPVDEIRQRRYVAGDIHETSASLYYNRRKGTTDSVDNFFDTSTHDIVTELCKYQAGREEWRKIKDRGTSFYRPDNAPNIFTHMIRIVLINEEGDEIHGFSI